MIRLPKVKIPPDTLLQLGNLQHKIDKLQKYGDKVSTAKRLFSSSNRPTNPAFAQVRASLTRMCSGARRCAYCEDSGADEVEHIKPKDLYPEAAFVWGNYVYACGPCNGPKNNKFAVFNAKGDLVDVTRRRGVPPIEPEAGSPALINPRWEDPLKFMALDLRDTFLFLPIKPKGDRDYIRADYTIKILRLNDRDFLLRARREAYDSYRARLSEYIRERDKGEPKKRLNYRIKALKRMQHPTVWREMKRQQDKIPNLRQLFTDAPEALRW
jgi:uncharacterized protein (TIGR02646 family)